MASDGAKLSHLRSRALIGVRGPDWRSFLQGLLTQDVETMAGGEHRYGALLTPQGRLLYDMFLACEADEGGVLLDVPASERHAIAQRLSLYRLRAKVEIGPAEGGADPRLPELGWRTTSLATPSVPGALEVDEDAYEAHRLALAATDAWKDGLHDRNYPIEANLDLLGGIDFKKGCFVGQETTSRMKRRGQIRTRMLPIVFDGPAPAQGAEVLAGELRAGEVTGGRDGLALALLRLDRLNAGPLTVDGRPVRAAPPEWIPLPAAGGEDD
ncbi:MAG: glycine cleavage system protein T [Caulobacterales bacterium 32-69-10]|nr:MAG: glycine cleavage system protein T [Caulobacterales bacterium 32-69-10]